MKADALDKESAAVTEDVGEEQSARSSLRSSVRMSLGKAHDILLDYTSSDSKTKNIGLLVFTCIVVAVLLFATHASVAEHALFHVLDVVAAAFVVVYAALRWRGSLGAASLIPASLILAWLLSLLISLSAPSRRRKLLGLTEGDVYEACEEGNIVLWLALGLTSIVVLVPMPFHILFVFGQLISLQHLILGLVFERPECSKEAVPRGGPGGFLLGLPPLWVSALQLQALAGLLSLVRCRRSSGHHFKVGARRYSEANRARRMSSAVFTSKGEGDSEFLVQNWLERLVQELAVEEAHCRQFLNEHTDAEHTDASDSEEWSESRAWQAVVESLLNVLTSCEQKLKERAHTTDQRWRQDLVDAFTDGDRGNGSVDKHVSGWLLESFLAADTQFTQSAGKTPTSENSLNCEDLDVENTTPKTAARHHLKLLTTPGLGLELHIGEWSFNALQVERERTHVLQVLGFELLRPFSPSVVPRTALRTFLEQLEDAYVSSNAYHSHVHGADMCNAFFFLAQNTNLWSQCELPDSSKVAMIIAALGHDVGHPGRNNAYLISSRHPLALRYNDRSVLENFHAATLMHILAGTGPDGTGDSKCQHLLTALSPEMLHKGRQLMITLILGTDTQKHLEDLAAFRLRLGPSFNPFTNPDDQQQSLCILFRTADISHSAKNWEMHLEWSRRCVQEFHAQGDEEKRLGLKVSPLCEREGFVLHTAQVGFLNFVCLPTWREVARLEARKVQQAESQQSPRSPSRSQRKPRTLPRMERTDDGTAVRISSEKKRSYTRAGLSTPAGQAVQSGWDISPKLPMFSRPWTASQNNDDTIGNSLSMPTGNLSKVMPFQAPTDGSPSPKSSLESPDVRFHSEEKEQPKLLITELCLVLCENNLQAWKCQSETDNSTSPPAMNSQSEPPGPTSPMRLRSQSSLSF